MRAILWVGLLLSIAACRDASVTAPVTVPQFSLRGAAFNLVAVDGKALPAAATLPIYIDSRRTHVAYTVRGGRLHFRETSDTAQLFVGPLDPLDTSFPTAAFAGTHGIVYVGTDSVMFDAFVIGPVSFGPSAVARSQGDTLRLMTIPKVTSAPAGFLGYLPPPEPAFYGEHLWLFVRERS